MTDSNEREGTFEAFSKVPVYIDVNVRIVEGWLEYTSQEVEHILDIASGAGTTARLLLSQWPFRHRPHLHCLDMSSEALEITQDAINRASTQPRELNLCKAKAEEAELPAERFDLALWGNGIHYLTPEALPEALKRIRTALRPGGLLGVSTTFHKEYAPPEAEGFYTCWVREAAKILMQWKYKRDKNVASPPAGRPRPAEDYRIALEEAGFAVEDLRTYVVRAGQQFFAAIGAYYQFAAGALHGYPVEAASKALVKAVYPALESHGQRDEEGNPYVPRQWLAILCRKPA